MVTVKMFEPLIKLAKIGAGTVIVALVVGVIGYLMNLYKLIQLGLHYNDQAGELAIRLVGILPPIGAIVGWF